MCGIYGSRNFTEFKQLYKLNTTRGNFANGHLFLSWTGDYEIEKRQGETDYDYTYEYHKEYNYYTGHTQSPTGKVRDYNRNTSHPFETDNWIVSHNGVLNNHTKLTEKFYDNGDYYKSLVCDVDSSIIPAYMEYLLRNKPYKKFIEVMDQTVKSTLDQLSGTYAVTVYNKPNRLLYIARCGSTLHYNPQGSTFSSVTAPGLEPVPECTLYRLHQYKFKRISNLKNNSSFLIF